MTGIKYKLEPLANGYSNKKLADITYSFESLSREESLLLHCLMAEYIGIDCKNTKISVRKNINYLSAKIGHKVGVILPPNLR